MNSAKNPSTEPEFDPFDLNHMAKTWGDMLRVSTDMARMVAEKNERGDWQPINLDPFNISGAYADALNHMMQQPEKLTESQFELWRMYRSLWDSALVKMTGGQAADLIGPDKTDKRFKSEAWTRDAVFSFIRQSYLVTSQWLMNTVAENSEGMDQSAARKLAFFTKQYIDALSPTNFALTNPDVIKATIESGGQNLVRGMKNLLEDVQRGQGTPFIRMTDENAFKVGENVATTKGNVIFRNKMMELIHYTPAGKTTFAAPLLIVPPWINKYYILDLKEQNSFVKWAVDQGHAVFMISWVNPDASMRDTSFDDYLQDGVIAALDAIKKQTGQPSVNAVGYCIGGTLLTMTLAYLKAKKQSARIQSATFLTTLIDFENAGDLKLFVDPEQLEALTARMAETGVLEGNAMKVTFNMLRANDLIWTFVVNNYLLGREPFPFDLLYWNSDSTNLPAAMHAFYLRHMYINNDLAIPGGVSVCDVPVDVSTIDTPAYFLSTREDHIAPWQATFAGANLLSGPVTFTLAASGHIAGVVNPPSANKYCFWSAPEKSADPDAWLLSAKEQAGSWWPHWQKWLEKQGDEQVTAINPAKGPLKSLAPAPGTYVKKR